SARWTIGFVDGLLWRHKSPCRRRPGFPSWSWAGWFGIAEWDWETPHSKELELPPENALLDISVERKDRKKIEWEQFRINLISPSYSQSDLTPFLHIRAQFVQVRFEYLPEGPPESAKYIKDEPGFYFRYCSNPLSYCDLYLSKEVE